jgi:nucleoid DNA-binding protein
VEPSSQLHIIWKATVEYIREKLLEGKGVNLRGFGAFTFDVTTSLATTDGIRPEFDLQE